MWLRAAAAARGVQRGGRGERGGGGRRRGERGGVTGGRGQAEIQGWSRTEAQSWSILRGRLRIYMKEFKILQYMWVFDVLSKDPSY